MVLELLLTGLLSSPVLGIISYSTKIPAVVQAFLHVLCGDICKATRAAELLLHILKSEEKENLCSLVLLTLRMDHVNLEMLAVMNTISAE